MDVEYTIEMRYRTEDLDKIMAYYYECEQSELCEEAETPPPYVCRLHPRMDYQRKPYWLRTRSNPHRRNYH